jgi:hypothetical protein
MRRADRPEEGPATGISTGDRAIDLLLQSPSNRARLLTPDVQPGLVASAPARNDDGKSLRDALMLEAALAAEEARRSSPSPSTDARRQHEELMLASPSAPTVRLEPVVAVDDRWLAPVKDLALALRDHREWFLGIAILLWLGALALRMMATTGRSRRRRRRRHTSGRR